MVVVPWVIDLDGVVWLGDQPVAGAAAAVGRLRRAGEEVAFVTNNASVAAIDVSARLAAMDIDAEGRVVTSAEAAATLVDPGSRVMVRGTAGARQAMEGAGGVVVDEGPVDVVVVGWHQDFTYGSLAAAHQAIVGGARFIATNDDSTYPLADRTLPGNGAIVAYLERSTGVRAEVAGKPHRPMAELLRARFGETGWVVGDRPETDGLMARQLGWRFGLVLSGITTEAEAADPRPDAVGTDLADLVAQVLG